MCHHVGFQPDTQGVGVSQVLYATHTSNTHQTWFDIDIHVVRNEVFVVLTVNTSHCKDLQDVVLSFLHCHTDLGNVGRQQRLCLGNAVLHVYRSHVGIDALFEIYVDFNITVRRSLRGHVSHVRHTVDILFKWLDHRLHDCVLVSTSVAGSYLHRRGRDIRVLLNRQCAH